MSGNSGMKINPMHIKYVELIKEKQNKEYVYVPATTEEISKFSLAHGRRKEIRNIPEKWKIYDSWHECFVYFTKEEILKKENMVLRDHTFFYRSRVMVHIQDSGAWSKSFDSNEDAQAYYDDLSNRIKKAINSKKPNSINDFVEF